MLPDLLQEFATGVAVVSGIAGFVLGGLAYRRTGDIKSRDLRIQLRKEEADLRQKLAHLVGLLDQAQASRHRSFAADGLSQSGNQHLWDETFRLDREKAVSVAALAPIETNHRGVSQANLEKLLVTTHVVWLEASELATKYNAILEEARSAVERRKSEAAALAAVRRRN